MMVSPLSDGPTNTLYFVYSKIRALRISGMRIILLSCILVGTLDTFSQTVFSSCSAPDSVVKIYRNDADHLNVKHIFNLNLPFKDSIPLDKTLSKTYLKALLAVYNATSLPARDTVVNLKIHSNIGYVFNNIMFSGDSTASWMINLKNNVFPTGNLPLDSLMNKYYLTKDHYYSWQTGHWVLLKSDTNFNAMALFDAIDVYVPLAHNVGINYIYGDGAQISGFINSTYTELTYSFGWGDCLAGCIFRRYWRFRVYTDCSVEYFGSYGAPLPSGFLTAGLKENIGFQNLKVYPNPNNGEFTITFDSDSNNEITVNLTNVFGELLKVGVYEINYGESHLNVNVPELPQGIYTLTIKGGRNSIYNLKFVKK